MYAAEIATELKISQDWRDRGVTMVVAHPDDEALFWGALECLC